MEKKAPRTQSPITLLYEMMSDKKYWDGLSEEKKRRNLNMLIYAQYKQLEMSYSQGYIEGIVEGKVHDQTKVIKDWFGDSDSEYVNHPSFIERFGDEYSAIKNTAVEGQVDNTTNEKE